MAVAPSHHDDAPHVAELLYRQHSTALRSYCRRAVGADDADEVVQTTFLRALGALNRGERPLAERAWLLTIARNVCATRATSAARRHELLDPRALEVASAGAPPELVDSDLASALQSLPEGQRRAFVLRAVHELSYDEIAAELDVSRAAVESWIFRARRKLAGAVDERRRRLALDLSSAAGAGKSLIAGSAVKIATVTVVAGTALAVGPGVPDPATDAPAPRTPLQLQASEAPAEVTPPVSAERRRERATRARAVVSLAIPEQVTPGVESPPAAVPTPAAEPQPAAEAVVRPSEEPATVAPPPAVVVPTVEVPTVDLPALDPPALELPKLEVPPLPLELPTVDPLVIPSVQPALP